ncbi:nicotinate phosphoribosyltransferase [Sinanaerobacter sp. ZZT-01]|uniref:nicotinate phosphoribosyltransferase n=1 Tax=Sinanaerobacter sp. ZZT-01 TaxID=3111540 RepID=UPI002D79E573|nr:nicotinate phosphoribosyltransferase [Sinanaerobacter sp. ZZT-01]WRR92235.1 nicotinate phosphoribosyltransferase [Sinanaerobacter sp. ZZT-01]
MERTNMTMLTDFYELTMANGYFEHGMGDQIAYFDMFFRKIPDGGGFAIVAGLEQVITYLKGLSFSEDDLNYLRSKGIFSEEFLDFLRDFKFTCDVWAIPEGTPVFPGEPLITVRGPVIQAQFVETMILLIMNHQSLIATKANRIVRSAQGRGVMEFGSRRAHGATAAIIGARAAYIGGCVGTACTLTDQEYGIPAMGTMAHSWVQMFDSELEAFEKYAELYPTNCVLLVDTYNVLKCGVPNAIKVFKEKKPQNMGIRIDSGDITYLTKRARAMLDEAGFKDCKIIVSNSFDEYLIRDVISQGAKIDSFGVGERLITSKTEPVFGGVYKLAALESNGKIIPKIKISENVGKITNPGFKKVYRLYDKGTNQAFADVITLNHERIPSGSDYEIFNPEATWKRKKICNFYAKDLRVQVFNEGELVYKSPTVYEIREYCMDQINTLWDEIKRFENPHIYYVDLSKELWELKTKLIRDLQG